MNEPADPYLPPSTVVAEPAGADSFPLSPASRWRRLVAALLDIAILLAAAVALFLGSYLGLGIDLFPAGQEDLTYLQTLLVPDVMSELLWIAPYLLLQVPLLWLRGQTIGKFLLGTRIVGPDGRKADIARILLRRDLPFMVLNIVPLLGMVAWLADVLLIFRRDRRCLHDHLAGTRVVLAR